MWSHTFVLADRIKGTLLAWTIGQVIAATISDRFDKPLESALPLAILGVFLLIRWWVSVPVALDRKIGARDAISQLTSFAKFSNRPLTMPQNPRHPRTHT